MGTRLMVIWAHAVVRRRSFVIVAGCRTRFGAPRYDGSGFGFFAARSPCLRARRGCPSIGPLDACEASMALPSALLSDASRRWRGGELDCAFCYERHRGPSQKLVGFCARILEVEFGWLLRAVLRSRRCTVNWFRSAALPRAATALKIQALDTASNSLLFTLAASGSQT